MNRVVPLIRFRYAALSLAAAADCHMPCRTPKGSVRQPHESKRLQKRRLFRLFAMPLVAGESAESCASLGARAVAAVKPRDFIEEILLRDVVDLTWEIIRLRKLKSRLLYNF